jgi:hypothetical protein
MNDMRTRKLVKRDKNKAHSKKCMHAKKNGDYSMGQAKIRKAKGDYPIIDQGNKDSNVDDEAKRFASQRCKPLPANDRRYHFPNLAGKDNCLVYCMDYCGGSHNAHIRETIGLGEMAAHIVMAGCSVIFASSLEGESLLYQVMIPSCNRVLSMFDVLPTPHDYRVMPSGGDEDSERLSHCWKMKRTDTGDTFTINCNHLPIAGLCYLAGVDVYGEVTAYDKWKTFSELAHVKEAKSQIRVLGTECAKHGFDAMLLMRDFLINACKNGELGDPLTWRRMSNIIEREWNGIGDWLA